MSIIDHIRVMEDNEQWEVRGIVGARSVSTDSCPGREGKVLRGKDLVFEGF